MPRKLIANPKIDGREIALTHNSVKILKKLNVWDNISNKNGNVIIDKDKSMTNIKHVFEELMEKSQQAGDVNNNKLNIVKSQENLLESIHLSES